MLFLLTDSTQKLKLKRINGTLIIPFYVSTSSPQLQRIWFLIKNAKPPILQQMPGGFKY